MHYVHYVHYLTVEFIVSIQVRVELTGSIEDHVWKDTRAILLILWIASVINLAPCSVLDGFNLKLRTSDDQQDLWCQSSAQTSSIRLWAKPDT